MLIPQIVTPNNILDQESFIEVLIQSFLTERKASGLAKNTIEYYRNNLIRFQKYCDSFAVTKVTQITPEFLRNFLLSLTDTHSPGGVHAYYRSIKAFLRWVEFDDIILDWDNPIRHVRAPKVPIQPIQGISMPDFDKLVKTCPRGSLVGERDKAIFFILLDTGLRASEFLNIDNRDVDLPKGEILIRQGKGRKPRVVYFGAATRKAIRSYLRVRKDDSEALFVTDDGDRLTYGGLRAILARRAELAELDKVPSAHDFRRAMALEYFRNGGDIFSLQRILGHSGITVLWRYLALIDNDGKQAHKQYSPVDRNQQ